MTAKSKCRSSLPPPPPQLIIAKHFNDFMTKILENGKTKICVALINMKLLPNISFYDNPFDLLVLKWVSIRIYQYKSTILQHTLQYISPSNSCNSTPLNIIHRPCTDIIIGTVQTSNDTVKTDNR